MVHDPLTLRQVVAHSSLLLDAHLPSFISHEPAHELLARLQTALEPLIAIQNDFRQLRAPVDAVLTLARREERRKQEEEEKRLAMKGPAKQTGGAGRRGYKDRMVRGERGVGDGVIGKWRVEDIVF